MKDKLDSMFDTQASQDALWVDSERFKSDRDYRNAILKERLLDIVEEVIELKQTFNLSVHKFEQIEDLYNSKIEIVDCIKYLIGLANLLGIDPNSLSKAFAEKSYTLGNRWKSQIEFTKNTKVVCFDLDGVGADYSHGFNQFLLSQSLKPKYSHKERKSYSFHQQYGITKLEEDRYQRKFIESGGFRELKLMDGFKKCINLCHAHNLKVVIISSRPAWIYNRIYEDTYQWLKKNGIRYHMLRWDKDKADTVVNHVHPAQIIAFIEDRDKHAIELAHIDVPVVLINRSYNESMDDERIFRVDDWNQIVGYIQGKIID